MLNVTEYFRTVLVKNLAKESKAGLETMVVTTSTTIKSAPMMEVIAVTTFQKIGTNIAM